MPTTCGCRPSIPRSIGTAGPDSSWQTPASDARGSELAIRRKLIEDRSVDVIIAVGSNFFYTVTLPVTLWFLDRGKKNTDQADEMLFIDARDIYNPIDRAHRDWTPQQIEFLANIVRLWRGETPEFNAGSEEMLRQRFTGGSYTDVPGLCAMATSEQIKDLGWSLNPGRYVQVPNDRVSDEEFATKIALLGEQFETLSAEAEKLTDGARTVLRVADGR